MRRPSPITGAAPAHSRIRRHAYGLLPRDQPPSWKSATLTTKSAPRPSLRPCVKNQADSSSLLPKRKQFIARIGPVACLLTRNRGAAVTSESPKPVKDCLALAQHPPLTKRTPIWDWTFKPVTTTVSPQAPPGDYLASDVRFPRRDSNLDKALHWPVAKHIPNNPTTEPLTNCGSATGDPNTAQRCCIKKGSRLVTGIRT